MSDFKVHFVCTGNIYRSRIAEAYSKSRVPGIQASSSGTQASIQHKGPLVSYTQRLLFRHRLIPFMKDMWSDTTKEDLSQADLVIFFGQQNYDYCRKKFDFNGEFIIWDVPDFDDSDLVGKPTDMSKEIEYLKKSDEMYELLTAKIDTLIKNYKLS